MRTPLFSVKAIRQMQFSTSTKGRSSSRFFQDRERKRLSPFWVLAISSEKGAWRVSRYEWELPFR